MRLFLPILLLCWSASAATYYVATTGNNANPGTQAEPWLNVWYAAKTAAAGDTVSIGAGTYNEYVTNTISGTAGSRIVFSGTRGLAGEWLTVIDPSTSTPNNWVAASEIGAGVYKNTSLPWETKEMTIDNKRVAYIHTIGAPTIVPYRLAADPTTDVWATGADFLASDGNVEVRFRYDTGVLVHPWNSLLAVYASASTTPPTTYLRFQDGHDPNGELIRCARNHSGSSVQETPTWPAIQINNQSYITWSNVLVRGAYSGFKVAFGSHDVTIQSNYVSGGLSRIYVGNGVYNLSILDNDLTGNFYGTTNMGAWITDGVLSPDVPDRENLYYFCKFMMGNEATVDYGVDFAEAGGSGNVVARNHIHHSLGIGLEIGGSQTSPMTGTIIASNIIDHCVSVGIVPATGIDNCRIYKNQLLDNDISFRFVEMSTTTAQRRIYIYRNCCWNPYKYGNICYFYWSSVTPPVYHPEIWIYHNSFVDGNYAFEYSSGGASDATTAGGAQGLRVLNNVLTSYYRASIGNDGSLVGAFDYNLVRNSSPIAGVGWFGSSNIVRSTGAWTTNGVSAPSFLLTAGSPAINTSLDTTIGFTLRGANYSALPQTAETRSGIAWDMGANEYGHGGMVVGQLHAGRIIGITSP